MSGAKPLLERSLGIWQKVLGPDHPHVALSLNNLAALHEAMAHHAEAESLFTQSLEILQRKLSPRHPQVNKSLNNLAEPYRKSGREIEAAEMENALLSNRTACPARKGDRG